MRLRAGRLLLARVALIVPLALAPTVLRALQSPEPPAVDASVMATLLASAPGAYAVIGGTARAGEGNAVPLFVQADAYRRADGTVAVPIAVGATVAEPWVLQMRLVNATDGRAIAEDATFTGTSGLVRQIREIALRPGRYTVSAALARKSGSNWFGTVAKQPLTIPDFLANQLVLSPVVIGDTVTPGRLEDAERPFVFGPTHLAPAVANTFRQSDQLHYAVRIYGWKENEDSKPDVSVEYVFYQQMGNAMRFFNRTKPQMLDAKTLTKSFDGRRGAISTGMSIPLANFPPGEFELTARVIDRRIAGDVSTSRPGRGGAHAKKSTTAAIPTGPGVAEQKVRFFVKES